jgi:hypothetical protein
MELHRIKKLLHIKRNNYQNQETARTMGEKSLPPIQWGKDEYPEYIRRSKH